MNKQLMIKLALTPAFFILVIAGLLTNLIVGVLVLIAVIKFYNHDSRRNRQTNRNR